ncbi:MAG: LysR family transcriptional regulator, partial [Planctomycetaceae bacterium]|nr:LysR family transcriptional regulator [Planctomycetaceae bacterium]
MPSPGSPRRHNSHRQSLDKGGRVGGQLQDLNYLHLYYFWSVAREGSITRACASLHVTQPTVSMQIRRLEQALGAKLFERVGRGLRLTD